MSPDCSPTQSPGKHKPQLLKNVSLLFALPRPHGIQPRFPARAPLAMAEERAANWSPKTEEMEPRMTLGTEDFQRNMALLSNDQLRRLIRVRASPDFSPGAFWPVRAVRFRPGRLRRVAGTPLARGKRMSAAADARFGGVFRRCSAGFRDAAAGGARRTPGGSGGRARPARDLSSAAASSASWRAPPRAAPRAATSPRTTARPGAR